MTREARTRAPLPLTGEEAPFPLERIDGREEGLAFLFGVLFNQGQRANKAWQAPGLLQQRLGTLAPEALARVPPEVLMDALRRPSALHRFPGTMARYLSAACALLLREYGGDARRIWSPPVPAKELLRRFEAFMGIGHHKAEIAVFLLTVEFMVPVLDDGTHISLSSVCPGLAARYFPLDRARFVNGPLST
jgi:endonuclease III